ncbi:SIMPL domain-containing protein [Trichocoleus sp. FACHB-591]|uniref:SIMPL domain-containing protein n=1 Tax=Trichocoleus sp. FACHB-591 TaxID=2692872 RepID=UPI001682E329|nr:SIMPL domain-containing protein [Trichocoleus sp. FACHB-591]MBD2094863.1 SIMPL domain-containing protein [Trichocoleus sp. FACHB-591]
MKGIAIAALFSSAFLLPPPQVKAIELKALPQLAVSTSIAQVAYPATPLVNAPRNITVLGQGQVTAPADIARLEIQVITRNPFGADAGAPNQLAVGNRPLQPAVLQPVVTALQAIGVPAEAVTVQVTSSESADVVVLLEKPTRPRVQEVVLTVNNAAQKTNRLAVQSIGAEYAVKNCKPLENASRRAALSDAQERLRALATAVRVRLGAVLQITELPVLGSPSAFSKCGSKVGGPANPLSPPSTGAPPYDPAASTEVRVLSQISITYTIE